MQQRRAWRNSRSDTPAPCAASSHHCMCYLLPRHLPKSQVQVEYEEGGEKLIQIWDVRGPTFIKEDWRPGDRFGAKIALSPSKYNTIEKMLFNVGLITPFAKDVNCCPP